MSAMRSLTRSVTSSAFSPASIWTSPITVSPAAVTGGRTPAGHRPFDDTGHLANPDRRPLANGDDDLFQIPMRADQALAANQQLLAPRSR